MNKRKAFWLSLFNIDIGVGILSFIFAICSALIPAISIMAHPALIAGFSFFALGRGYNGARKVYYKSIGIRAPSQFKVIGRQREADDQGE